MSERFPLDPRPCPEQCVHDGCVRPIGHRPPCTPLQIRGEKDRADGHSRNCACSGTGLCGELVIEVWQHTGAGGSFREGWIADCQAGAFHARTEADALFAARCALLEVEVRQHSQLSGVWGWRWVGYTDDGCWEFDSPEAALEAALDARGE